MFLYWNHDGSCVKTDATSILISPFSCFWSQYHSIISWRHFDMSTLSSNVHCTQNPIVICHKTRGLFEHEFNWVARRQWTILCNHAIDITGYILCKGFMISTWKVRDTCFMHIYDVIKKKIGRVKTPLSRHWFSICYHFVKYFNLSNFSAKFYFQTGLSQRIFMRNKL